MIGFAIVESSAVTGGNRSISTAVQPQSGGKSAFVIFQIIAENIPVDQCRTSRFIQLAQLQCLPVFRNFFHIIRQETDTKFIFQKTVYSVEQTSAGTTDNQIISFRTIKPAFRRQIIVTFQYYPGDFFAFTADSGNRRTG